MNLTVLASEYDYDYVIDIGISLTKSLLLCGIWSLRRRWFNQLILFDAIRWESLIDGGWLKPWVETHVFYTMPLVGVCLALAIGRMVGFARFSEADDEYSRSPRWVSRRIDSVGLDRSFFLELSSCPTLRPLFGLWLNGSYEFFCLSYWLVISVVSRN